MWIVAVAWIYVVGLMAITEPNVVAGIMTFLGYCVLPLSILYYLSGSKRRRLRINEAARRRQESDPGVQPPGPPGSDPKQIQTGDSASPSDPSI
jgi:hypothetical protein